MRKLKTILQYRYTFKVITIIVLLAECIFLTFYQPKSNYTEGNKKITAIVTKYQIDGDKLSLEVKAKEKLIANYYFKAKEEKEYFQNNLQLGSTISLEGTLERPSNNTVPNTFNYRKYLQNKKIFYIVDVEKITLEKKNESLLYEIKNKIIKRIESIDGTGYLKTFILGDKNDIDEEMINAYQNNGISHLFAVSGMHISLLVAVIFFILNKLTYNKYLKYSICLLFLLFYLFLTGSPASILRATIMYLLFSINKALNLKIRRTDIVLFTLDIILIIDPYIVFDVGFQFSYLISATIILLKNKLKRMPKKWQKNLYVSWVCFLVSFPICIYHFYQVNFLQIIWNLFFIPFVSIVLFPFCLLVFIFPILESILIPIVTLMEKVNDLLDSITIFQIIFSKPSLLLIIIYYLLISLSIYKKKYVKYMFLLMIIHKNIVYFNPNMDMIMLDVSQGDSILISLPYNQANILIDTAGIVTYQKEDWQIRKKNYSIVDNKTIPYLKGRGIDKIDYLILTHGDVDHMQEAINLIKNFKVDSVIFNKGEYNTLESELIKVLEDRKIKYQKKPISLSIGKTNFYFLETKLYDNENENSIITYFQYQNYKILLMADATTRNESEIIQKYNLKNIDILKIGHHGSDTSTSKEFIEATNPKISLISVGKNNRYGHPKKEVLNRLQNSKVYRTDLMGSVLIRINNTCKITFYPSES